MLVVVLFPGWVQTGYQGHCWCPQVRSQTDVHTRTRRQGLRQELRHPADRKRHK